MSRKVPKKTKNLKISRNIQIKYSTDIQNTPVRLNEKVDRTKLESQPLTKEFQIFIQSPTRIQPKKLRVGSKRSR